MHACGVIIQVHTVRGGIGVRSSEVKLENVRKCIGEPLFVDSEQPACAAGGGIGVVRQRWDQVWGGGRARG